ncbi:glucose-1-phosphate adenylyltransferase [Bacillus canaveralius]|uniref:Glucose-1-phosphate adenylyltransferase n=1 Tax=Bacillus canaveralius TaxID=1403243 RepID=A0A2N5GPG1_9BACI|nr:MULTISPECIES: sugar phosphate nucleotidyltransferase [Bacillus]PLR84457.1 glucose-1-phosphate adenylyltransferase [Bacillus canaveralius]PLR86958.1 glucose-1-phosphate adenylyltransferase [Bacillus sp. V33-4]PLS00541.1 glucose-1-phosphate adenylyltransferase [Bacillus canaveralius]RSK43064.1 glucose-1-phosphate adenylyltransferase [Bacillus canaveralius]
MKKRLLGVIDATTYHEDLEELIIHRSLAAVPIAGRYRLIDFVLSNMVNSEIESVAIFPKFQYRSLMDHLGSGRNWDLNRKRDGLFFFPSPNLDGPQQGIGSFTHFAANLDYFYRSTQDYAVIANCYTVLNMDFRPVLDWHLASGCDITEIRQKGKSLEMYLVKKSLLIELIETRENTGYTCMRDVVADIGHSYRLCTYNYTGFTFMIDSINTYFNASMSILQPTIWQQLFLKDQPIYTKVKDEPPTRYLAGARVKNAMIANGCILDGYVENSIISRGVKIGKNSVIRNSIIMQKCQIAENCVLDSVILDKDVKIEPNTVMKASSRHPYVIRKGTVQGALMNS